MFVCTLSNPVVPIFNKIGMKKYPQFLQLVNSLQTNWFSVKYRFCSDSGTKQELIGFMLPDCVLCNLLTGSWCLLHVRSVFFVSVTL